MPYLTFQKAIDALRSDLKSDVLERLPIASAAALTWTAIKCRDEMKKHIELAFDRPTPYAINAARAAPATIERLTSVVLLKEFGKGTKAEQYLGPEISGGPRGQKREERALSSGGMLAAGGFLTPGSGAALNQYGNEQPAEIVKIMSILKVFGEQGYRANRAKDWSKKTRVGQIFVVRVGRNRAGLKPGVYRRTEGGGVVCLQRFVKKRPQYRVRLPFDDLVKADAGRIFPGELDRALAESANWKKKNV